jgi:CubicO group peptidase (beta-lactamase class C family)|tara:strand:- start:850 stop:2142 length:1293 start_codon:yes stop_codon:yes gene_type:complete
MARENHIIRIARSVSAVLLLTATTGIATAKPDPGMPTGSAKSVGMSAERLGRIGPAMQRYIDDELVPGTVTLVARRGKVVHFEARGLMDVQSKKPMREDAVFRIASMTKPITSVALMMLWEEGKFQLRDPVSKFIPEFADQRVSTTADASGETGELVDANRESTIRDMLTHTAGLANSYIGNGQYYREQMRRRPNDTLGKQMARLAALPLNYHPGEAWQYSTATSVVGRLVEVISGQTLAEFMDEKIFKPLDMPDTHFYLDDDKGGRLMSQYTPGEDNRVVLQDPGSNESRWITAENKSVFSGSGGLVSTAHDYTRFQSAMLNGGELDGVRLLSPSTVQLMMDNHTDDIPIWLAGPGMGFGLGWGVVVDRGKAATPLSEGSVYWGGAFCTISWIDPAQELVGILMTQVRPYTHINIRQDFQVLVHQAIVD